MKPQLPHFEKGYYESLIIVLDTLEQCLALQAQATNPHHRGANARPHGDDNVVPTASGSTSKHDEAMNVKLLLKEICQLLDMPNDNSNMVNQIRILTSKVLFALSVNNFSAVFSRISGRLQELSVSNEENPDHTDIELIQVPAAIFFFFFLPEIFVFKLTLPLGGGPPKVEVSFVGGDGRV